MACEGKGGVLREMTIRGRLVIWAGLSGLNRKDEGEGMWMEELLLWWRNGEGS